MGLSFRLRLLQTLECKVCHQAIDSQQIEDDNTEQKLFGVAKYARCPSCSRTVESPENKDENYRARVRRFCKRREKNVE